MSDHCFLCEGVVFKHQLLTVEEAASFLRVHPKTIYRRPARYGFKKIRGVGYRADISVLRGLVAIDLKAMSNE